MASAKKPESAKEAKEINQNQSDEYMSESSSSSEPESSAPQSTGEK